MLFARRGRQPSIPVPRSVSSRSTPSRIVAIPTTGPRWHDAVVHLEDILSSWALPVSLARRWMHPAREALEHQLPLELFVQLDPVDGLVSIELWDDEGRRVYAAESFLGTPETVDVTLDRRVRAS